MKRVSCFKCIIVLLLVCASLFSLSACGAKPKPKASQQISMFIGLGNTYGGYYEKLHAAVLEDLGIDIQYVYCNTSDTTSAVADMIGAYDLPADIVVTASPSVEDAQRKAFLDLSSYSNVLDYFITSRITKFSVDGAIYQIPFTTRLIGIEYNKTLFEEMGWELPETYEDMLLLKEKAQEAGYPFAVAGGAATGHGFNYLMHLMGTQYLSIPDGTEWLNAYLKGETDISDFSENAGYFKKYAESGLYGNIHSEDWLPGLEFSQTRALFYYNILNDATSYDGFRYTEDGRIYGAEYDGNGNVVAVESHSGNAVFYEGQYIYYDSSRPELNNLIRYSIPGAVVLHDKYGIIPWISESGASNCFAAYDSMYLALDKALAEEGNEEKLACACKILEYMAGDRVTRIFLDLYPDGYVATHSFSSDNSRLYNDCAEYVSMGYLMPWYYSYFDSNTIVDTGEMVNSYLTAIEQGTLPVLPEDDETEAAQEQDIANDDSSTQSVTYDDIIRELDYRCNRHLSGQKNQSGMSVGTFGYKEAAEFQGAVAAIYLQSIIDNDTSGAYDDIEITVSLVPYTEALTDLPLFCQLPVVQSKIYSGGINGDILNKYVNTQANSIRVCRMSGAEINRLLASGFDASEKYGVKSSFPYALKTKGDTALKDNEYYYVAMPENAVAPAQSGLIDWLPYNGTEVDALTGFFSEFKSIAPDGNYWH